MNYLLRNIDKKTWKLIKIYAAQKEITIKKLIITTLLEKIKKDKNGY